MALFTLKRKMTEVEIIDGCRRNEPVSQRALYEKYAGLMFSVCRRYVKVQEVAEEMLSNGFVKAFKNIDKFEFRGSFEGWLRRIMVNECLNYLQTQKGIWLSIEDAEFEVNKSHSVSDDTADLHVQDLLAMVDELPTGYRTVFNMYCIEGYKHNEIGEILGISENTSKTQLMRARETLQKKYHERFSTDKYTGYEQA